MRPIRAICLLALFFASVLPISSAQVQPYHGFYAFGDSLSDNGNDEILTRALGFEPAIPPSTPPHRAYYDGRFSNGPVAFEYLWQMLAESSGANPALMPILSLSRPARVRAIDFAFGGSGSGFLDRTPAGFFVPGLRAQVEMFRATIRRPPGRALFAIFTGANDYLGPMPLAPSQVVGNITEAIRRVYQAGARDVMVLNLPDLGSIPLMAGTPQAPLLSALSAQHNELLAASLADLAASLPDLSLLPIDVHAVLGQLPPTTNPTLPALDALVPAAPGAPPTSLCLILNPATCPNVPTFDVGLDYLFWDVQHPTTGVHRLLALYLYDTLTSSALVTRR